MTGFHPVWLAGQKFPAWNPAMLPAGFRYNGLMTHYLTAPVATPDAGGIPYIIVNDVAERFSFYGLRAILVIL